jgi:hypothetical protein
MWRHTWTRAKRDREGGGLWGPAPVVLDLLLHSSELQRKKNKISSNNGTTLIQVTQSCLSGCILFKMGLLNFYKLPPPIKAIQTAADEAPHGANLQRGGKGQQAPGKQKKKESSIRLSSAQIHLRR